MIRTVAFALTLSLLPFLTGCGSPSLYPVTGTVKLKGKVVPGCKVILAPAEGTDPQSFGFGITDKDGRFEIQQPQGEKGIRAGKYKVGFVAWVDGKSGKPVPADAKPSEVEGGVKNIFGDKYETPSSSPETIDVPKGGTQKEFDITL